MAADLARRGVRSGERVAVWLPSRIETAIALLACSRNGYVCCPSLHRDHTVARRSSRWWTRMRAAALIAQPGYGADADRHDIFAELVDRDFLRARLSRWRRSSARPRRFADLVGRLAESSPSREANPNQVIYLPFTSGTTGRAKGRNAQRQHPCSPPRG